MRDEQQRQVATSLREQLPVVQRGDHGLAGAGRSDHEIAMTVMAVTLDRQGLEHPLLMRVGPDIKVGERDRRGLAERAAIVLAQRDRQFVAIDGRVVRLEVLRGPVALERHADAVDDVRRVHRRQPHVPLQAVEERRVREIRRADECGRQA